MGLMGSQRSGLDQQWVGGGLSHGLTPPPLFGTFGTQLLGPWVNSERGLEGAHLDGRQPREVGEQEPPGFQGYLLPRVLSRLVCPGHRANPTGAIGRNWDSNFKTPG